MKVQEFIEKTVGEIMDSSVITRHYVPISEKRIIARDIVDRCVDELDGYIVIDEIQLSIDKTVAAIEAYTNLEIDDENEVIYDAIEAYEFMDIFIRTVGNDVYEFFHVIECEKQRMLAGNSIEAQVAKVANNLNRAVNSLSSTIENAISELDVEKIIPEGAITEELANLIKLLK